MADEGRLTPALSDAAQARPLASEAALHRPAVPVHELRDPAFLLERVGTGLVGGRANADLVFLDHATVLIVRGEPDLRQFLNRVILALDRLLVHQPFRREL